MVRKRKMFYQAYELDLNAFGQLDIAESLVKRSCFERALSLLLVVIYRRRCRTE
jgi:hypothetical protein